jgi:hypothetical protein
MVDYRKLADKAKAAQDADNLARLGQRRSDADPNVFFRRVIAHIDQEMERANVELRKTRVGTIARNHLPNFEGVIFLSIGTASLCRVDLVVQATVSRIRAILTGPPNGNEISRKEYVLGPGSSSTAWPSAEEIGSATVGASPEKIAEDIVSGIVLGHFE